MAWILRICAIAGAVYLIALVYAAWARWHHADPSPLPEAQAIVVLSGPGARVPGTAGQTLARLRRGVGLWQAGAAPLLVVSGGGAGPGTPLQKTHAWNMAQAARDMGIPESAIRLESRSGSTLQNAVFTADIPDIDLGRRLIVVTQPYHLPRAGFSFRWAGFTQIALVAATDPPEGVLRQFLGEGVKWPFNILRAQLARLALRMGLAPTRVTPWLR